MKHIFFISLVAIFLLSACRQQVTVKSKVTGNIVVYSELKTGEMPEIYLTEETTYYQYIEKENQQTFIKDANVTITGNGQTDVLELMSKQDTAYNGWSGTPQIITVYYYKGHYPLVANEKYSLEAKRGNKKISAETTLPTPITIKTIKQQEVNQNGQIYMEYVAQFDDTKETNDYYIIRTCSTMPEYDTLGNPTGNFIYTCNKDYSIYPVSDKVFTNNQGQMNIWGITTGLPDSITYDITLKRYTQEWGDYISSVYEQNGTAGNPLVEPTLLKSNIKGDGIGIFGGETSSPVYTIKVK